MLSTRTVKILGKVWKLRYVSIKKYYGECDPPSFPNKEIRIAKGLSSEKELEILLHEMLHAAFWNLDESTVDRVAKDFSKALIKLGYKKND